MGRRIRFEELVRIALLALVMTLIPLPSYADSLVPTDFRFIGSGYGHGVGMSQIGARGQALSGKTAVEILKYYYTGVDVTPYPDNALIRVNIANLIPSVNFSVVGGKGSFALYQGDIAPLDNPEPIGRYTGDFTATFTNFAGTVVPLLTSPTAKLAPFTPAPAWTLRWETGTVIAIGTTTATTQYKYGQIVIKSIANPIASYLAVTNTLRLHDEYLFGIGEVPSSWPDAALEAQVIASRTFALTRLNRIRPECDCNIYSTISDQSFIGYSKEIEPIYGAKWKAAVMRTFVDDNSAQVLTLSGKPIYSYFFSSSGGASLNIKDVWGGGDVSYLQSVPDPWSLDNTLNPRYIGWSRFVSQEIMAQAFGLGDVLTYVINSRMPSGSIASITAVSSTGQQSTLTGEVFRSRVRLPSTWIYNSPSNVRYRLSAIEWDGFSNLRTIAAF